MLPGLLILIHLMQKKDCAAVTHLHGLPGRGEDPCFEGSEQQVSVRFAHVRHSCSSVLRTVSSLSRLAPRNDSCCCELVDSACQFICCA